MNRRENPVSRARVAVLAVAGVALIGVAGAQTLTPAQKQLMQRYGGVLAPDCSNYLLPQLLFLGDSLVVRNGGKPVLTGRNVKAAPAHFGSSPPAEFETAVASDVEGGEAMVFVFYRNAAGVSVSVEGGPKVMAALPAALKGKRVPHCDPNRNAAPASASAGGQAKAADPNRNFKGYALTELGAAGLLYNAKARDAYYKALGPLVKEPWLAKLDGPSSENKAIKVAGADFVKIATCKNHDCYDNTVLLLWAAPDTIYGKVVRQNRSTLIGAPPPAVATELEKLWKAEFRSQPK